MKRCKYCGEPVDDRAMRCPACSGTGFINICPNCGTEFEIGMFCPRCGVKMGQREKICPRCGNHYFTNACGNCGFNGMDSGGGPQTVYVNNTYNTNNGSSQSNPNGYGKAKDRTVALLLCIFLGTVGAHKFYEGNTGMGILYLFTGGLCGIGWLVDIFVIAGKPNPYYV